MLEVPLPIPDEQDLAFARELIKTMPDRDEKLPLYPQEILPIPDQIAPHFGSTDTGDVSWNCPTVQLHIGSWCIGTAAHSWQAVAQGKSPYAHASMLYAGKAVAGSIIRLMEEPDRLAKAKEEHFAQTGGKYITVALVNAQTGFVVAGGNTAEVVGA